MTEFTTYSQIFRDMGSKSPKIPGFKKKKAKSSKVVPLSDEEIKEIIRSGGLDNENMKIPQDNGDNGEKNDKVKEGQGEDEDGNSKPARFECAIDAEFVLLADAEEELHSSGEVKMYRPRMFSLARVSVLRANGRLEGVPFIDDYIETKEPIENYLTEFSGIHGKLI
ncbi:hypothetical protein BB560_006627 [Smittium megazygosporum]|uniref:Uncharacterized protein n=1 Tax=Smittium megazygosporum TaxID=133381 RepID=A0A2T9Y2S0_9FUNG|nr:hypothetical protein BB560_006627 [Smittium megazygosporum]